MANQSHVDNFTPVIAVTLTLNIGDKKQLRSDFENGSPVFFFSHVPQKKSHTDTEKNKEAMTNAALVLAYCHVQS